MKLKMKKCILLFKQKKAYDMRISDWSSDVCSSDLRYKFGDIDLTSTLPNVDVETLRSQINTRQGEWYSSQEVEQTIAQLTEALANQQYAFVDIRPLITRNRDETLINITYDINEGTRVFVDRINITGNVRTVDQAIRRKKQLVSTGKRRGGREGINQCRS